ncbi:MAG: MlaA family lipoprotein [Formosimonas sp.]
MRTRIQRFALGLVCLFWVALAQAQTETVMAPEPALLATPDPLEKFNRDAFQMNEAYDEALFRPVAKAYQRVLPTKVRGCVHGVLGNLNEPYTAFNNVLQGKFKAAGQDMCRFIINSTVGLAGCVDVASKLGLPKHHEDFGQTLGKWGVPAGSFVMLPLLGPSSVRDALAKPIDLLADPIGYIKLIKLRNVARGVKLVDTRAELLGVTDLADDVAVDKYTLMRDAWLQSREAQVRDEDYEPEGQPLESAALPATP